MGELDLSYNMLGIKDYIKSGEFQKYVPLLQEVVVVEDTAHFINQEKADEINKHIYNFIQQFWTPSPVILELYEAYCTILYYTISLCVRDIKTYLYMLYFNDTFW